MLCPQCHASDVEIRDHEQQLKRVGGVMLGSAGVAAGAVGGAAAGASTGAAIGTLAGPLGIITGATIGTFVGAISAGVTGGFLGRRVGHKAGTVVDKNIFFDYTCLACGHRFNASKHKQSELK
ncbi:hypothetical protein I2F27_01070 [Acinetobacter sp. B5B]|uniref:hypothetical protein n=1 Tax=Acinetobacter baretiae TaxID=2605383 RepID=UPI0018C305FC|nr:hypothetical protein [Acinetobacter baretiae]MBF7681930.1 hypothetical protein [Acinetobacter baretiae]MBF7685698.1 hypothetical protein [Acinetobacter baretiae]